MERRYALFIAASLAIVLASQALQMYLFPKPPAARVAGGDGTARPAQVSAPPAGAAEGSSVGGSSADGGAADAGAAGRMDRVARDGTERARDEAGAAGTGQDESPLAPRARHTLGSLDRGETAGMLVTLTSRGAAVERIELADPGFVDQDDRAGHLGHLAVEPVEDGCRVGIVGKGTPADRAGLKAGDVIVRLDGTATPDPRGYHAVLAKTKPGHKLAIDIMRGGSGESAERRSLQATLGQRPLEVVRPEFRTLPVADPDADPCDPLSFRLSLESRADARRTAPLAEIEGQHLCDRDWEIEAADASRVRFIRRLPGGLVIAQEYRLVCGLNAAEERAAGSPPCRLELRLELLASERPESLVYALDGPTGLPTEGWWYAARVARDWGTLAVRDVAVRFAGEASTLISGLKMADGSLEHPASSVRDGKPLSFAGVDALYFASALVPATAGPEAPALDEVRPLVAGDIPAPARRKLVDVTCRLVSREIRLEPGEPVVHRYEIFAGPKRPELLAAFGAKGSSMDDLVYYGWFGWVARPMIAILHAIHAVIGNYGLAILLLTVMVRGAMFPISRKQAVSSQKMQVLQPEMKAIAEKYKNDPEKRTKATQELWRKHDYNPAGGCLLVFIQIPIFMGLYRSLATDVELRQASLFGSAIRWCSNLAAPDMFYDWSQVLPGFLTAPEGWLGPYLNLFPLATIGLFLWQQKLFMPPAVDEQSQVQQQVMKYMMFFMALMFFKVPCGLCLYFIASSLWGIAERLMLPTAPVALAGVPSGPEPTKAKSFFENPFAAADRNGTHVADELRRKRQARKKR